MKTLTLFRHAEAAYALPNGIDKNRTLTQNAANKSKSHYQRLINNGIDIDLVLCSTATRCVQTVASFETKAKVVYIDSLYESAVINIFEVIKQNSTSAHHVLVCAHNPALAQFIYTLSNTFYHIEPADFVTFGYDKMPFDLEKLNSIMPAVLLTSTTFMS